MSSIISTGISNNTMDSTDETLAPDLTKACNCDYTLLIEVIDDYVSTLSDEKKKIYQDKINALNEERAKQPYTLDSYWAQCQP